ncbi:MAG: D-aminoacylase [Acidobacteria bacterium]|nr:D-aminoacylase [Acidobacteriota bacterium]
MNKRIRLAAKSGTFAAVLALAGLVMAGSTSAQEAKPAAFVITGARVADGTGKPLREVNVRVVGERITKVGNFRPDKKETVIDGKGLVLAPGFIDAHNHSTEGLERDPLAESQISQGLTTVILGQDGGSPWPIADYLKRRKENPPALNFQVLVGHATIRRAVMGDDFRRAATAEEISKMASFVEQAMKEGAVGLSSGLEYTVGSYSTTEEVVAMARMAGRYNGFYISHIRDEADKSFDAMREAIAIGEQGHLPSQITHIKMGTVGVWGKSAEAVRMIEDARKRGLDISADCYPYDAWHSTMTVLVPNKKFDDPVSVQRALDDVGGGANVTVTECERHPEYLTKNLDEIAKSKGVTAVDVYMEIVRDGGAGIIGHSMKDEDIRTFYTQPWVMVSSDGGINMKHPRGAGTYPKVLGRYVREQHWLTLEEAVRKMTSLPAWRMGLKDRGTIREGAYADLVLFNPETVKDNSTFAEPFKLSDGIEKVFVNGTMVWDGGKATGARPGRALERQPK